MVKLSWILLLSLFFTANNTFAQTDTTNSWVMVQISVNDTIRESPDACLVFLKDDKISGQYCKSTNEVQKAGTWRKLSKTRIEVMQAGFGERIIYTVLSRSRTSMTIETLYYDTKITIVLERSYVSWTW